MRDDSEINYLQSKEEVFKENKYEVNSNATAWLAKQQAELPLTLVRKEGDAVSPFPVSIFRKSLHHTVVMHISLIISCEHKFTSGSSLIYPFISLPIFSIV